MSMYQAFRAAAPRVVSDLVKWEAHVGYSTDSAALAPNIVAEIGSPLAKNAQGQLVLLDPAAPADLVGFARAPALAQADPRDAFPYVARVALIADTGVVWPAGFDAAAKAATFAKARELGLIVERPGV